MIIGILKENGDKRVSMTPAIIKKMKTDGLEFAIETGAGDLAGYIDSEFTETGAKTASRDEILKSDVIFSFNAPELADIAKMKSGSLLICHLDPHRCGETLRALAEIKVNALAMEMIPRTSRAQSMDSLSSQANIAGYRAVIEASALYKRFFPLMMTSAGMAKPAKVIVLGAGVAGLQAIATAKRLGGKVSAYDIRPEVKEQIESLGASFIELDIGEEGSGEGGYAKELSEEGKAKQKALLAEKLKAADIIITTANIPGRKAPTLIEESVVDGMAHGSVIVDLAAINGGNCESTTPGETIVRNGVTICGTKNFAELIASDASLFYATNLKNLFALFWDEENKNVKYDFEDDIVEAAMVVHNGEVRFGK